MKLFLGALLIGCTIAAGTAPQTFVWSDPGAPYLVRLRTDYKLNDVVSPSDTDYKKIQK